MSHHLFELDDLARLHIAELHRAAAQANLVRHPSPLAVLRRVTARALIATGTAIGGHDQRRGEEPRVYPAPEHSDNFPADLGRAIDANVHGSRVQTP